MKKRLIYLLVILSVCAVVLVCTAACDSGETNDGTPSGDVGTGADSLPDDNGVTPGGTEDDIPLTDGDTEGLVFKLKSDGTYTVWACTEDIGQHIKIPSRYEGIPVTEISPVAFKQRMDIVSVTIPDSVTTIGFEAFMFCEALATVKFGNGLKSIGGYAFYNCLSLTEAVLPESVEEIGGGLFAYCESLVKTNIPDSFTRIPYGMLAGCSSLPAIDIPDGVTYISDSAFAGCENLASIDIPEGVTYIGELAFGYCEKFTSVELPESLTEIGASAFRDCLELRSINIPDSVGRIGKDAFLNSDNLLYKAGGVGYLHGWAVVYDGSVTDVTIEDGTVSLADELFFKTKITSVKLPNTLKNISDRAFSKCDNLKSLTIPASVVSIGQFMVSLCNNLREVCFEDVYGWKYSADREFRFGVEELPLEKLTDPEAMAGWFTADVCSGKFWRKESRG